MEEEVSEENIDTSEASSTFSSDKNLAISSNNPDKQNQDPTISNSNPKKHITVHTLTQDVSIAETVTKLNVDPGGDEQETSRREESETWTDISPTSERGVHGKLTVLYTSPNKTFTFSKKSHPAPLVVSQDMSSSYVLPAVHEAPESKALNASSKLNDQKPASSVSNSKAKTTDSEEPRITTDAVTLNNPNNNNNIDKSVVIGPSDSQSHLMGFPPSLNVGRKETVTESSVSVGHKVSVSLAAVSNLSTARSNLCGTDSVVLIKTQSPCAAISSSKQCEQTGSPSPTTGSRKSPIATIQNEQLSSLIHKASTLIHGDVVQPFSVSPNQTKSPVPTSLFPTSSEQREFLKAKTSVQSCPVQKKTIGIKCQEETSHQLKNFLFAPIDVKASNTEIIGELTNQSTESKCNFQTTAGQTLGQPSPKSAPKFLVQFEKTNKQKQPVTVPHQPNVLPVLSTGQDLAVSSSAKATKKRTTRPRSSKGKERVQTPVADVGDNEHEEDEDSDFIPVGMLQLSSVKKVESFQMEMPSVSDGQHQPSEGLIAQSQQTVCEEEKQPSLEKASFFQHQLQQQLLQHMKQQQQRVGQQSGEGHSKLPAKTEPGKERQEYLREQGGIQLQHLAHVAQNEQQEKQSCEDSRHQQHQLLLQLVHQAQQQQKQLLEQQQQQPQPARHQEEVSSNPIQSRHSESEEIHKTQGFQKNQGLIIHHHQPIAGHMKHIRSVQMSMKKQKVDGQGQRGAKIESQPVQTPRPSSSSDVQSTSAFSERFSGKEESLKQLGQSNSQQQLLLASVPKIAEKLLQQSVVGEALTCGKTEEASQLSKEQSFMQSRGDDLLHLNMQPPTSIRTDQMQQRPFTPTPHLHPSLNKQHPEIARMLNSPVSPRQPSSPRQSVSPRRPMSPHHSAVSPSHFASPKQPVSPRQSSNSKPIVSPQPRQSSSPWHPVSPSQSSPVSPANFVSLGQYLSNTGNADMAHKPQPFENHQSLLNLENADFSSVEKQQQLHQSVRTGQPLAIDSGQQSQLVTCQDQYQVGDNDSGSSPVLDSPSHHQSIPSSFTSKSAQAFSPGQVIHHRPSTHKNIHSKMSGLQRLPLTTPVQLSSPSVPSSTIPMSLSSVLPPAQTASPIWQQLQSSEGRTRARSSQPPRVIGLFSSQPVDIQKLAKQPVQHVHQTQVIKSAQHNQQWEDQPVESLSHSSFNSETELGTPSQAPECSQHNRKFAEKQTIEMQLYPSASTFSDLHSPNNETIQSHSSVKTSGQARSFQGMTSLTEKETSLIQSLFASGTQNESRQESQTNREFDDQAQSHHLLSSTRVADKSYKRRDSSALSLIEMRKNEGGLKVLSEIASERYQLAVAGKDDTGHSVPPNIKERSQDYVPCAQAERDVPTVESSSNVSKSLSNIERYSVLRRKPVLPTTQHSNPKVGSGVSEATLTHTKVTGSEKEKLSLLSEATTEMPQSQVKEVAIDKNEMPRREVRQRKPKKPFEQEETPGRRNSRYTSPSQKTSSNSGKKTTDLNTGLKPSHKKGQSQKKNVKSFDEGKLVDQTEELVPENVKDKVNVVGLENRKTANRKETDVRGKIDLKEKICVKEKTDLKGKTDSKEDRDDTSKAARGEQIYSVAADSENHASPGTDSSSHSRRLSRRLMAKIKDNLESKEEEKEAVYEEKKERPSRRSARVNYKEDGSDSIEETASGSRQTSISSDDVGQIESNQRMVTRSKNRKTEDDGQKDNSSKSSQKLSDSRQDIKPDVKTVAALRTSQRKNPIKGETVTCENSKGNKHNGRVSTSRSRSPVDSAKVGNSPRRMTTRQAIAEQEKPDTGIRPKRRFSGEFLDELPQWRKRIKKSDTAKNVSDSHNDSCEGQTPVKTDSEILKGSLELEEVVFEEKVSQVSANKDLKKKVANTKTPSPAPNIDLGGEENQAEEKSNSRNEQRSKLKDQSKSSGGTGPSKSDITSSKPGRSVSSKKDRVHVTRRQNTESGGDGKVLDSSGLTRAQGSPVASIFSDAPLDSETGIRGLRPRNTQAGTGNENSAMKSANVKPIQQSVIKSTPVLLRSSIGREQQTSLSHVASEPFTVDSGAKANLPSYCREKKHDHLSSAGERRKMIMYKLVPVLGEDVSDVDEALIPVHGYYIPGGTKDCILLPHDFMEGPLTSKISSSPSTSTNTSDLSKALPESSWTGTTKSDQPTPALPVAHSIWSVDGKLQQSSASKVTHNSEFSSLRIALSSTVESPLPLATTSSVTWTLPYQHSSSSLALSSTLSSQLPPPLPTPPPSIGEPVSSQYRRTWSVPLSQNSPSPYRPSPSWNTTPPSILSPSPLPSSSPSTAWNLSTSSSTLPVPPNQHPQSWPGPPQPSVQDSSWQSSTSVTAAAIESWSKEFFPSTIYSSSSSGDHRRPVELGHVSRDGTSVQQPYSIGSVPSQPQGLYTSNPDQTVYNSESHPETDLNENRSDSLIQGFLRQVSSNPGGFSQELAGFNLAQQDFSYLENRLRQAFSPNTLLSAVAAYDDNSGHGTGMSHENSLQESINLVHTVNLDMEEDNSANLELTTLGNVSSATMPISTQVDTGHNLTNPGRLHDMQTNASQLTSPPLVEKSLPTEGDDGKGDAKKIVRERKHQYEVVNVEGIRKFKCLVCSKSLGAATIYRHLRTHDPDYKVTCTLCGKQYTQRHSLSLHMRKFHRDQESHSVSSPATEESPQTDVDMSWTAQSPTESLSAKSGVQPKVRRRASSTSDPLGTSLDQAEIEKQQATHRQVEELRRMKAEKKRAAALKKKALDLAMDETIAAVAGGQGHLSPQVSTFNTDATVTSAGLDETIENGADSQTESVPYSKVSTLSSDYSEIQVARRTPDMPKVQFQLNAPHPVMSTMPQSDFITTGDNSVKNQMMDGAAKQSSQSDGSNTQNSADKPVVTKDGKHVCPLCNSQLNTRNGYLLHMRRHRKVKSKFCSYCGKGFHTGQELRSHERTHTGERPYKCPMCYSAFAHSGSYVAHKKGHVKRGETTPFPVVDGKIQYPPTFRIPRMADGKTLISGKAKKKKIKKTPLDTVSYPADTMDTASHPEDTASQGLGVNRVGQDQWAIQPTSVIRRHSLDVNCPKLADQGAEVSSRRLSLHEPTVSLNESSINRANRSQTPVDTQSVSYTDHGMNLSNDRTDTTFGSTRENFSGQSENVRSSGFYNNTMTYSQALQQRDFPTSPLETTQDYYRQDKFTSPGPYEVTPTMPVNLATGKTQPLTDSLPQHYPDSGFYPCQQQPHYEYSVEATDGGFQQDEYQTHVQSYKADPSSSEIVKKLLQHYNVPSSTYQETTPVDYSHQVQSLPDYNGGGRETDPSVFTNSDMDAVEPPSYSTSIDQKQFYNYNHQIKTGSSQQSGQELQQSGLASQTQEPLPAHGGLFQNPQSVVPVESYDHPSRYSSFRDDQISQTPHQSYP